MAKHSTSKTPNTNAVIALALIVLGLGVLLYPVVATQWNNYSQSRAADEYSRLEKNVPPETLHTALEQARRYNAQLGEIDVHDAWNTSDNEHSPEYQRYRQYLSVLSETEAMGRIIIPSIDSDLPIYHGTSERALSRGVGHLYGTDLPVGGVGRGEGRHVALSAHTGLQDATLWDNLPKVKNGDNFYIAAGGEKFKYEVHDVRVVVPSDTSSLKRQTNKDLVTLITCTPYGINTHRLLITGHRVPMDPADESTFGKTGIHWQWWMWAILVTAVIIIVLAIIWWFKFVKGGRTAARQSPSK
ncbi:class C sortase [Corynebacterium sp. LaCa117]|uniref:class C sortase n=1 Tax=Corynebacterium sp. LaCa117 TaxID=3391424 RepID=UPI003988E189